MKIRFNVRLIKRVMVKGTQARLSITRSQPKEHHIKKPEISLPHPHLLVSPIVLSSEGQTPNTWGEKQLIIFRDYIIYCSKLIGCLTC